MLSRKVFFWFCTSLLCLALGACSSGTEQAAAPMAPAAHTLLASTLPPAAEAPAPGPCANPQTLNAPVGEEAPAGSALDVRYDGDSNTIVLRAGQAVSLAAVSEALNRPELLRQLGPSEWLLSANIEIESEAGLRLAGPEVQWLKLKSDEQGFVALRAMGGQLEIDSTCISSWDVGRNAVDENYNDGRAFVLARDGARMVIRNAELRYLGYNADESYGLVWRVVGTSGEIINSHLAYNYFGLYTDEVSGLVIRGNRVYRNVLYGIDPHTRSNNLVIEDNHVHENGKHGIILADECQDSVIRNNLVYHNLHHGIVLYQRSDRNLVEGNTVYGNVYQGININESSANTVRNNTVYGNFEGGIGVGTQARQNVLIGNDVHANQGDGILFYADSDANQLQDNIVRENDRYGIHLESVGSATVTGNQVLSNTVGIVATSASSITAPQQQNQLAGNRETEVRLGGS